MNIAVTSNNDGRLVTNATTSGGANSSYQMVAYDAFGSNRDERRYHSFNFFARGDGASPQAPSSSNRRWLAVVDGSARKVLYNKVLPDFNVPLSPAEITTIRDAVNMAELPVAGESFSSWAEARISDAGLRGENDDPDFDGMSNLFEYAYGTDPSVADSEKGPRILVEGGVRKLFYQRSVTASVTPLSIIGGSSPDSDTPVDPGGEVEVGPETDGVEAVTVTLPSSLGQKSFLRLTTATVVE